MSILSKKAVLAALSVGGWNARKRDDKASAVVHKHFKADDDSGNYNKTLFDLKDESWVDITKARTDLRDFHYRATLPWVHDGAQILAAATYLDYNSEVSKKMKTYLKAANHFIDERYLDLKREAKAKRNGLFNEQDYPSVEELHRKFYAEVRFLPVPDSGHVIVDLQNKEVARIKADTDAMIEEAVEQAQAALWLRLLKPVKHMASVLKDPKGRFHDTLVDNIREQVEMIPAMNLTEDAELASMVAEVKKHLTKTSPETLREDTSKRAVNARKAAELARKMRSLMPVQP